MWPPHSLIQKASPDTICPLSSHEGRLILVAGVHPDLIIAQESIHEVEELVASSDIHYEVNSGRGKLSFGQARFTSVKSMQSHHLPFSFLTRTTFANQLR